MALSLLAVVGHPAAQSSRPQSQGDSWMPLGIGAEWRMRVTGEGETKRSDRLRTERARLTRFGIAYGTVEGEREDGDDWLLETRTGLYSISGRDIRAMQDGKLRYRAHVLSLPLGATNRWDWNQPPESGGAKPIQAELVAMREEVVVPAGTFVAACVQAFDLGEEEKRRPERTLWFARGIGIVKVSSHDHSEDGKQRSTHRELVSFTPPVRAGSGSLADSVAAVVPMHREWKKLGKLEGVEMVTGAGLEAAAPYAFARLRFAGREPIVVLVRGPLVLDFDPRDAECWNALLVARPEVAKETWEAACATVLGEPGMKITWSGKEIERVAK